MTCAKKYLKRSCFGQALTDYVVAMAAVTLMFGGTSLYQNMITSYRTNELNLENQLAYRSEVSSMNPNDPAYYFNAQASNIQSIAQAPQLQGQPAPTSPGQVSGGQVSGGQVSGGQVSGGQVVAGNNVNSNPNSNVSNGQGQGLGNGNGFGIGNGNNGNNGNGNGNNGNGNGNGGSGGLQININSGGQGQGAVSFSNPQNGASLNIVINGQVILSL